MKLFVGQLRGPFLMQDSPKNLLDKIRMQYPDLSLIKISHIGIHAPERHFVSINGGQFRMGKTGILEIQDTDVLSIFFNQDEEADTAIDYTIEIYDEGEDNNE